LPVIDNSCADANVWNRAMQKSADGKEPVAAAGGMRIIDPLPK
jgi:hypothetical protein